MRLDTRRRFWFVSSGVETTSTSSLRKQGPITTSVYLFAQHLPHCPNRWAAAYGSLLSQGRHHEGYYNRRSATVSTTWSAPFFRISVARGRVGKIFSSRLARLVRSQIANAVAVASSSDSGA